MPSLAMTRMRAWLLPGNKARFWVSTLKLVLVQLTANARHVAPLSGLYWTT
jgi:hypothetical protein